MVVVLKIQQLARVAVAGMLDFGVIKAEEALVVAAQRMVPPAQLGL